MNNLGIIVDSFELKLNAFAESRAWADCALFASCGAFETEYNIRDG